MNLSRREMIALTLLGVAACDAQDPSPASAPAPPPATGPGSADGSAGGGELIADAGPLAQYAADGVYDAHRPDGFFVIRRGGRVWAMSSICTHKGCKVRSQSDASFVCKCHGSTFDAEGRVTKAPATRDLPRLEVRLDPQKHLLVRLPGSPAPQT